MVNRKDRNEAFVGVNTVGVLDAHRLKCEELLSSGDWLGLLQYLESRDIRRQVTAQNSFFEATALLNTLDYDAALTAVREGLIKDPSSAWGGQLEFEILLQLDREDEAFANLTKIIDETDDESAKTLFVQHAAEKSRFDAALKINETRKVIRNTIVDAKFCLCLQIFNKPDTLEKVLLSLLNLNEAKKFTLLIIQDRYREAVGKTDHSQQYRKVSELTASYIPKLARVFSAVEFLSNDENMGTAPTCRKLLDYACKRHDGFMFIEDDCLLSEDALEWALYHLDEVTARKPEKWFFSAESIFFDRQNRDASIISEDLLASIARHDDVKDAFVMLDFVPSTCFGASADVWKLCNKFRSFPRGPESLSRYLKSRGIKTVAPVVPRAADIGMQNLGGYSVENLGSSNVKEDKNTLLLSSHFDPRNCKLYAKDLDELYGATSLLNIGRLKALCTNLGLVI